MLLFGRATSFLLCVLLYVSPVSAVSEDCPTVTCDIGSAGIFTSSGNEERSELYDYVHSSCFCDELCVVFEDCCGDSRSQVQRSIDTTVSKEYFTASPPAPPIEYRSSGSAMHEAITGTWWIHQCPKSFESETVRNLCEDWDDYQDHFLWWPVSNRKSGIMYRNMYCAICWNDVGTDVVFWNISVECQKLNDDDLLGGDELAGFPAEPVSSLENAATESRSQVTPSPVDGAQDILMQLTRCNKYLVNPFGVQNLRDVNLNIVSTCPMVWTDQHVATRCKEYTSIVHDNATAGKLYKNQDCAICNGVRRENIVCDWQKRDAFKVTSATAFNQGSKTFYPISVLFEPRACHVTVIQGSVVSTKQMECHDNEIFDIFQQKCRTVYCPQGYVFRNGSCVPIMKPPAIVNLANTNSSDRPCPEVKIPSGMFELLKNGNLVIKGESREINATNFRLKNSSVYICLSQALDPNISIAKVTQLYEFELAASIISATGQILSIICLALNFIVYAILPPLRNTPGKTLMSLVVALFFSQLTFLVGAGRTNHHVTCVLAATLIHYFILASFVWMNALSLDLALAFSTNNLQSTGEHVKRRRFVLFSLYGWMSPLFIVGISLSLDLLGHGEFMPRYGRHICWISNPSAVGVLFILPLALLLTVNIILYIFTAVNIYKATKAAEMVRKKDKLSLILYVKLSIIMGGTWIFAFVWILTKSTVVQYVFIILNSLQGTFIFFSFVVRRKVLRMLKQNLCRRKRLSHSSNGRPVTSCTEMHHHDRIGRKLTQPGSPC